MKFSKIVFILSLLTLLSACGKTVFTDDPAQTYSHYSAQQLYVNGKKSLQSRSYKQAIQYYEALESLYPFGTYARKGQLDLIYAYYKSNQYAMALAASDQYIHVYPRSPNVDYAYYMKGLSQLNEGETWLQRNLPIDMSLRDLSNAKQAFYAFRDLVQFYPNSRYAPDAKQHMIALRNMFAKHELEIGNYYYKRHAYVASANRASYIIEHYQHAPQVKQALILLVKSNRALGLTEQANNAYRVLQTNFPRTRV